MRNMIGQIIKIAIPIYPKIIFIMFDSAFSKRSRISYEFGSNFPPKFVFFWLGLGFRGAGLTNHPFAGLTSGTTDLGTDIISGAILLPSCGRWREVGVRILWRAGRTEGLIFPGLGVWNPCVKPEYFKIIKRSPKPKVNGPESKRSMTTVYYLRYEVRIATELEWSLEAGCIATPDFLR